MNPTINFYDGSDLTCLRNYDYKDFSLFSMQDLDDITSLVLKGCDLADEYLITFAPPSSVDSDPVFNIIIFCPTLDKSHVDDVAYMINSMIYIRYHDTSVSSHKVLDVDFE